MPETQGNGSFNGNLDNLLNFAALNDGLGMEKADDDETVIKRGNRARKLEPRMSINLAQGPKPGPRPRPRPMPGVSGNQTGRIRYRTSPGGWMDGATAGKKKEDRVSEQVALKKQHPAPVKKPVSEGRRIISQADKPGRLLNRLTAMAFDVTIVSGMFVFLVWTALKLNGFQVNTLMFMSIDILGPLVLLYGVLFMGYFLITEGMWHQSIGKRILNLRIESLTFPRLFLRTAGFVVSILPAGLGLVWCLLDERKRAWHDVVSGTEVRRLH